MAPQTVRSTILSSCRETLIGEHEEVGVTVEAIRRTSWPGEVHGIVVVEGICATFGGCPPASLFHDVELRSPRMSIAQVHLFWRKRQVSLKLFLVCG
jgi:hypothetical protein